MRDCSVRRGWRLRIAHGESSSLNFRGITAHLQNGDSGAVLPDLRSQRLLDPGFQVVTDQRQIKIRIFAGRFHVSEVQGGDYFIAMTFQKQLAGLQNSISG